MGKAIREHAVKCADCGVKMRLRGESSLRYVCPSCGATLIAAPTGQPLGVPATKETRRWRRRADTGFDCIWRPGNVTRRSAQRCIHCDRNDFDGVDTLPDNGVDIEEVRSYAEATREVAADDQTRSVFDWRTHLGVCPECQQIHGR
jgi:predicted RNA-binding Zn-ribbon protein involved in translation (DUF1610 family)